MSNKIWGLVREYCVIDDKTIKAPCIKISDDIGKHMGQKEEIEMAFKILDIKQPNIEINE